MDKVISFIELRVGLEIGTEISISANSDPKNFDFGTKYFSPNFKIPIFNFSENFRIRIGINFETFGNSEIRSEIFPKLKFHNFDFLF